MKLHCGDPCVFCLRPHDEVTSEECPQNMLTEARLREIEVDHKAACLARTEAKMLVQAYRILRSRSTKEDPESKNKKAVQEMLASLRSENNGL